MGKLFQRLPVFWVVAISTKILMEKMFIGNDPDVVGD
jgi:hypothetical protein